jgi:hypothetical protein
MDPTVRLRGLVGSLRSGSPDDFPPFHSVSYSESMPVSQSQQGTFLPTESCRSSPVAQMQYQARFIAYSFCGLKPMSQSRRYNPTTGYIWRPPTSITPAQNPTILICRPMWIVDFFGVVILCATSVSLTIPAFQSILKTICRKPT